MATGKRATPTKKAALPANRGGPGSTPARDKLDAIGIEAICERIEAGETMLEIAVSLGVSQPLLSAWLRLPAHADCSARAREDSAEAWLDRGLEVVASALSKDAGIDASAARAYAQECARRAGLRNQRYVERTAHEHSGPNGGAFPVSVTLEFK